MGDDSQSDSESVRWCPASRGVNLENADIEIEETTVVRSTHDTEQQREARDEDLDQSMTKVLCLKF